MLVGNKELLCNIMMTPLVMMFLRLMIPLQIREVWNRQLIPICTITMKVLVSIVCKFVKQPIQSSVEH